MTSGFPWKTGVQLGLESAGVAVGYLVSTLEGAHTGGYFLILVHAIFIFTMALGLVFYYPTYRTYMAGELKLIFSSMYVFCYGTLGVYFYFIVRVTSPCVFDIILTAWGPMTMLLIVFYIFKMVFFTIASYEIYAAIQGTIIVAPKVESIATEEPKKEKVPLYLMDYEKMFGKK